jgi:hypothetical protein
MLRRTTLASLAGAPLLVSVHNLPGAAQQKTALVFSEGPTGGTLTPMAAATAEVIKGRYPCSPMRSD